MLPSASMRVKRLRGLTNSLASLRGHFRNSRRELRNSENQKATLAERLIHRTPFARERRPDQRSDIRVGWHPACRHRPARSRDPLAHAGYDFINSSQRIIHVEFDRMRGHLEAFDFG